MNTEQQHITIAGLPVLVVRKDIKNLHLSVNPPQGRVRVAAPMRFSDEAVRLAVIDKLGWIKRQRRRFKGQERQTEREMVTGETHFFQGRRYRLNVVEHDGPARVRVRGNNRLELRVRPGADRSKREALLQAWYRKSLKEQIPQIIDKWAADIGVELADWGVKKMKTKWGSCNHSARRIWINLELAKKPPDCLEYIVVHEMIHLLERHHDDRFKAYMDRLMPNWQLRREKLNAAPLVHCEWGY